ncbi:hypothetical protein FT641_27065 [Bacillus paranthracis]|uniref:hypothetical protein n=1 Tax=Bacillus paranthracis TaxID=2026186 RepID=UPI0018793AFA|nr:hypothetical protein [Bacillus paranthracis]MBE7117314.1 hypothetical protein [Bacillus paranthracis]MBE7134928.1 hypothetical protein [Bacillus paranthracis]MBE7156337.1 hypothetical protein [Bacillus paranthracis]
MKRLPPILYPFYLAYAIIIQVGFLIGWLLGFWRCHSCKKTYWVTEDYVHRVRGGEYVDICESCYTKKSSK